jgi:AMP-binding enzyme C-terminal domain
MVRQRIGPVAAFRTAVVVPALPKTRSGKVLRGTMQKIADGNEYKMPATIDGLVGSGSLCWRNIATTLIDPDRPNFSMSVIA